jgi:hypothetical protein
VSSAAPRQCSAAASARLRVRGPAALTPTCCRPAAAGPCAGWTAPRGCTRAT